MCFCGLPIKAKGLCAKHYLADYRNRISSGEQIKTPIETISISQSLWELDGKKKNNCAVALCYNPTKSKGLCAKHYLRLNRAKKKANQK